MPARTPPNPPHLTHAGLFGELSSLRSCPPVPLELPAGRGKHGSKPEGCTSTMIASERPLPPSASVRSPVMKVAQLAGLHPGPLNLKVVVDVSAPETNLHAVQLLAISENSAVLKGPPACSLQRVHSRREGAPMRKFKSPITAAIASAALTASVVGGVAIAQTSSSEIRACVAENSGNVRIVSNAGDCKPNESSTSWNQQGPQGAKGETGPAGATNIVQRNGSPRVLSPGGSGSTRAVCLPGETAVGGGAGNSVAGIYMLGEWPRPQLDGVRPTQWEVMYHNTTDVSVGVTSIVLCASP